jgi:hypothetical protein
VLRILSFVLVCAFTSHHAFAGEETSSGPWGPRSDGAYPQRIKDLEASLIQQKVIHLLHGTILGLTSALTDVSDLPYDDDPRGMYYTMVMKADILNAFADQLEENVLPEIHDEASKIEMNMVLLELRSIYEVAQAYGGSKSDFDDLTEDEVSDIETDMDSVSDRAAEALEGLERLLETIRGQAIEIDVGYPDISVRELFTEEKETQKDLLIAKVVQRQLHGIVNFKNLYTPGDESEAYGQAQLAVSLLHTALREMKGLREDLVDTTLEAKVVGLEKRLKAIKEGHESTVDSGIIDDDEDGTDESTWTDVVDAMSSDLQSLVKSVDLIVELAEAKANKALPDLEALVSLVNGNPKFFSEAAVTSANAFSRYKEQVREELETLRHNQEVQRKEHRSLEALTGESRQHLDDAQKAFASEVAGHDAIRAQVRELEDSVDSKKAELEKLEAAIEARRHEADAHQTSLSEMLRNIWDLGDSGVTKTTVGFSKLNPPKILKQKWMAMAAADAETQLEKALGKLRASEKWQAQVGAPEDLPHRPNLDVVVSFAKMEKKGFLRFHGYKGHATFKVRATLGAERSEEFTVPVELIFDRQTKSFIWKDLGKILKEKVAPIVSSVVAAANPEVHDEMLSEIVKGTCEDYLNKSALPKGEAPRMPGIMEETEQQFQQVETRLSTFVNPEN